MYSNPLPTEKCHGLEDWGHMRNCIHGNCMCWYITALILTVHFIYLMVKYWFNLNVEYSGVNLNFKSVDVVCQVPKSSIFDCSCIVHSAAHWVFFWPLAMILKHGKMSFETVKIGYLTDWHTDSQEWA